MKKNLAIFSSGSGTNTENIIRHFENDDSVCVALVVSNKSDAFVLERVKPFSVPTVFFEKKTWSGGEDILEVLREYNICFIVLAGFLARVPDCLLHAYSDKIINIHPSLLPKFGGKGMYGAHVHQSVIAAGEKESGITIHYINEHYDEGAIILQAKCPVLPEDTPDTLAQRVHALEYEYYPQVIEKLLAGISVQ